MAAGNEWRKGRLAIERLYLDALRDALDPDKPTSDEIATRELELDKDIIQLVQNICKNDKLPQEKIEVPKADHEEGGDDEDCEAEEETVEEGGVEGCSAVSSYRRVVRVDKGKRWVCPIATITDTVILDGWFTLFEPHGRKQSSITLVYIHTKDQDQDQKRQTCSGWSAKVVPQKLGGRPVRTGTKQQNLFGQPAVEDPNQCRAGWMEGREGSVERSRQ
ncbi:hypothetical protein BDM02DRAFT_3245632 [Thelephora ganbajun]|uniref:Uncharacterized protein n=1 Tax=Thelephora ganbajun TaxID=370292 RepID=A0ACB6ZED2_THEGA|nr:hypothetical protein BDM02DRAFT_3245632 [Thelephora ganbajun]